MLLMLRVHKQEDHMVLIEFLEAASDFEILEHRVIT